MKNSEVEQQQERIEEGLNKFLKKNGIEEPKYKYKAIGYLDITEPYEKGIVSQIFVNKLKQIWDLGLTLASLGHHTCEFCEGKEKATSSSEKTLVDKENKIKYIFPKMIFHYMEVHEFKPSNEFIKCVMNYNIKSEGINISQVFDEELAKLTDKNISEICKRWKMKKNKLKNMNVVSFVELKI